MNTEDRYYEPEDADYDDIDDYISDYARYEMRRGGDLDPMEQGNFCEAVSQLGLPEELENWEDATPEQQALIVEYWEEVAQFRGEESYYANL